MNKVNINFHLNNPDNAGGNKSTLTEAELLTRACLGFIPLIRICFFGGFNL